MPQPEYLRPVMDALREFEEAVKKHEHHSLVDSEVMRRQDVDRARQRVLETVTDVVQSRVAT